MTDIDMNDTPRVWYGVPDLPGKRTSYEQQITSDGLLRWRPKNPDVSKFDAWVGRPLGAEPWRPGLSPDHQGKTIKVLPISATPL